MVDDDLIVESLGNPKFDFKLNERITRPGIAIVFNLSINLFRVWLIQRQEERLF